MVLFQQWKKNRIKQMKLTEVHQYLKLSEPTLVHPLLAGLCATGMQAGWFLATASFCQRQTNATSGFPNNPHFYTPNNCWAYVCLFIFCPPKKRINPPEADKKVCLVVGIFALQNRSKTSRPVSLATGLNLEDFVHPPSAARLF